MTRLARPDAGLCRSWCEAVAEFGAEAVSGSGIGHGPANGGVVLDAEGCAAFVDERLRFADEAAELPDGLVHCDYFWITDGQPAEVVGFLALRHRLNDWLLQEGGHIGYSVRPSRRRQGHASRALRLALRRAARLGLDRVLLTCDEDNIGSRATIEGCGGAYEDTRNGKRRYWLNTVR